MRFAVLVEEHSVLQGELNARESKLSSEDQSALEVQKAVPTLGVSAQMRSQEKWLVVAPILIALSTAILSHPANANFVEPFFPKVPPPAPTLRVFAPEHSSVIHTFSNFGSVTVEFAVHADPWISESGQPWKADYRPSQQYSPDCSLGVLLDEEQSVTRQWVSGENISIHFDNLKLGLHTVDIWACCSGVYRSGNEYVEGVSNCSVYRIQFYVEKQLRMSLEPTQDTSFDTSNVLICFLVNMHPASIAYSLDGRENVQIGSQAYKTNELGDFFRVNFTGEISEGTHSITAYATDSAGNRAESEPLTFMVKQAPVEIPPPSSETTTTPRPSPTATPTVSPFFTSEPAASLSVEQTDYIETTNPLDTALLTTVSAVSVSALVVVSFFTWKKKGKRESARKS